MVNITPGHAVQTHAGFVSARRLTHCGYLLAHHAAQGAAPGAPAIEDIERLEESTATVYALALKGGNSLICNGIIVGDATAGGAQAGTLQGSASQPLWPPEVISARSEMSAALRARAEKA